VTDTPSPEFLALEAAVSGRYVLERELGRGGMGVVFLAREVALERPVAIKLLPPALAVSAEARGRFLQEARTAARLAHPHIVPIHAVEERGDLVYFVMGYVPGRTLAEQVRAEGPLPPAAVARLVQEVAWALAHAHEAGVVHRDIKPENILLERGTGRALVADFGIARLGDATPATGAGTVLGTAHVVSPEQAAGEPLDGRSDLYSLGATACYALTGRFPFEGADARGLLAQHLTLPAPPVATLRAGVPPALAAAIDRCLAKSPDGRFPTASALAEAVGAAREGTGVPDVLRRLTREISAFGVDLTGYGTLAGVAVLAQLLTARHDFFGMGQAITIVIGLVLLSLTALRGMSLARLLLEAAKEGWNEADLTTAVAREARRLAAEAGVPRPGLFASAGIYLAGLAGLLWFWLVPKVAGQASMEGPLAWLIELVSYIGPIALGRWFGARIEAPRGGLPGLFSRFIAGVKLRFIWFGPRHRPLDAAAGDRPTEVLLADAARDALRALPDPDRRRLADVERMVTNLEAGATRLRRRLEGLDQAAARVGDPTAPGRAAVARELAAAKGETAARLGTAVSALENVRLELLRLRAGLVTADGLTESLEALRTLEARADLERGGNSGPAIP
jgi:eukaryotic-like serine/threonine-protein kinase